MAAARELSISRGAVSRTIKELERFMDVALFVRSANDLRLTDAGREYACAVGPAISEIARASIDVRSGSRERLTALAAQDPTARTESNEHATT